MAMKRMEGIGRWMILAILLTANGWEAWAQQPATKETYAYWYQRAEKSMATGRFEDAINELRVAEVCADIPEDNDIDEKLQLAYRGYVEKLNALVRQLQQEKIRAESNRRLTAAVRERDADATRAFNLTRLSLDSDPDNQQAREAFNELIEQEPFYQQRWKHGGEVLSVAISGDGQKIATGTSWGIVRVWDTQGRLLQVFSDLGGPVDALDLSPDGQYLVYATQSGPRVILRNLAGAAPVSLQPWKSTRAYVGDKTRIVAQFSPEGKRLFLGKESDPVAYLTNLEGMLVDSLRQDRTFVGYSAATWSSTGDYLLLGRPDGKMLLWDRIQGQVTQTYDISSGVDCLAFSPMDDFFVSGSREGVISLWNVSDSTVVELGRNKIPVKDVVISPDGRKIFATGNETEIQSWETGGQNREGSSPTYVQSNLYHGHDKRVSALAASPNGKYWLSVGLDRTLKWWPYRDWEPYTFDWHAGPVGNLALSPQSHYLFTSSTGQFPLRSKSFIWRPDGRKVQELATGTHDFSHAVFSPDEKWLLTTDLQGLIKLWDSTGHHVRTFLAGGADPAALSWWQGDTTFLYVSRQGLLSFWHRNKGLIYQKNLDNLEPEQVLALPEQDELIILDSRSRIYRMRSRSENPVLTLGTEAVSDYRRLYRIPSLQNGDLEDSTLVVLQYGSFFRPTEGDTALFPVFLLSLRGDTLRRIPLKIWADMPGLSRNFASITLAPDGRSLLVALRNGHMGLASQSGQWLWMYPGHNNNLPLNVGFSSDFIAPGQVDTYPQGRGFILSSGRDLAVIRWAPDGTILNRIGTGHQSRTNHLSITDDGQQILTAAFDPVVYRWAPDGTLLGTHGILPDERQRGFPSRYIQQETASEQEVPAEVDFQRFYRINQAEISPDGRYMALFSRNEAFLEPLGSQVQIPLEVPDRRSAIGVMTFTPDSRYLLTGHQDGLIRRWDLYGRLLNTYRLDSTAVGAISCPREMPNTFMAWSREGAAALFTLNRQAPQRTFLHDHLGSYGEISPDGKYFFTLASDGLYFYEINGRQLWTYNKGNRSFFEATFSRTGQYVYLTGLQVTCLDREGHLRYVYDANIRQVVAGARGKYLFGVLGYSLGRFPSVESLLDDPLAYTANAWELAPFIPEKLSLVRQSPDLLRERSLDLLFDLAQPTVQSGRGDRPRYESALDSAVAYRERADLLNPPADIEIREKTLFYEKALDVALSLGAFPKILTWSENLEDLDFSVLPAASLGLILAHQAQNDPESAKQVYADLASDSLRVSLVALLMEKVRDRPGNYQGSLPGLMDMVADEALSRDEPEYWLNMVKLTSGWKRYPTPTYAPTLQAAQALQRRVLNEKAEVLLNLNEAGQLIEWLEVFGGRAGMNTSSESITLLYEIAYHALDLSQSSDQVNRLQNIQFENRSLLPMAERARSIQWEIACKEKLLAVRGQDPILISALSGNYSDLAYYKMFTQDFGETVTYARKALELDPDKDIAYTNLPLGLLFTGDYEAALEIYLEKKDTTYISGVSSRAFKTSFLQDFEELEKVGITHPDVSRIRAILEGEASPDMPDQEQRSRFRILDIFKKGDSE